MSVCRFPAPSRAPNREGVNMYTDEMIAEVMGCTVEQLRSQHAKNAAQIAGMLVKATETGRKVNGFTAQQLSGMYKKSFNRAYGKASA